MLLFSRKPNIVVIGAGKIAHSLIPALIKSGYNVSCVMSRNSNSASSLAKKYSIPFFTNSYDDISQKPALFILCVPDGQIQHAAQKLSSLKLNFKKSLFVHLSGSKDISSLNQLKVKGANIASLHIMQTFPSQRPVPLKGFYAAVETGNNETFVFLKKFAADLNLISFKIESESKSLYHLAGVFASNFLAGNIAASKTLLGAANVTGINFIDLMNPIVNSTFKNISTSGPEEAISGPVERGDVITIKKHLSALKKLLKEKSNPSGTIMLQSYISQSLFLLEAVKIKHGKLSADHKKIKELLLQHLSFTAQ